LSCAHHVRHREHTAEEPPRSYRMDIPLVTPSAIRWRWRSGAHPQGRGPQDITEVVLSWRQECWSLPAWVHGKRRLVPTRSKRRSAAKVLPTGTGRRAGMCGFIDDLSLFAKRPFLRTGRPGGRLHYRDGPPRDRTASVLLGEGMEISGEPIRSAA
jgi:hypothetical protein